MTGHLNAVKFLVDLRWYNRTTTILKWWKVRNFTRVFENWF